MTFALAFALALAPAAPRQHCGIETRVWCLRATLNPASMTTEGEFRVWSIVDLESDTSISVKESLNCDSIVDEPIETKLTDGSRTVAGKHKPSLTFTIPDYECSVEVSWMPSGKNPDWSERSVLSAIWVGIGEKTPLLFKTLHGKKAPLLYTPLH